MYKCKCGNILTEDETGILNCTCGLEYYISYNGELRCLAFVRGMPMTITPRYNGYISKK